MNERKNLLVGGVSLGKGRLKSGGQALLAVRNELERSLEQHGYLLKAPFKTVSLIVRYGERDNLNPEIGNIDQKNCELPVAIQLDMQRLQSLSMDQLIADFRSTFIEVLCDVAANFDLPYKFLDELRKPAL